MSDDQAGGSVSGNGEGGPMVRAVALLQEGRLEEAKSICQQVLDGNGDDVDAIYAMGWIAFCQNVREKALADFRRVIELAPEHARAHNNIGTILMNGEDTASAAGHLEAAIAAAPDFIEAYSNLGAVRMTQGEPNAAREPFEKAVELIPEDPTALTNLAAVKMQLGEVDEAIADFEKVVELTPEDPTAYKQGPYKYLAKNAPKLLVAKNRMACEEGIDLVGSVTVDGAEIVLPESKRSTFQKLSL